jgi:hypothetical protein
MCHVIRRTVTGFSLPKVGTQAKSSDVAIEFVKYDPSKPEEMQQYEMKELLH